MDSIQGGLLPAALLKEDSWVTHTPSLSLQVTAPPSSMAAQLPLPPPPPDPQFVLRGTQSAVHALHFWEGAQGQGHPLLLSG